MDREPCPFRIVDDAGGAFGFGKAEVLLGAIVNGHYKWPKRSYITPLTSKNK